MPLSSASSRYRHADSPAWRSFEGRRATAWTRRPQVATTIITKIELLRGRFEFFLKAADGTQLLKAQKWLVHTESLLTQLIVIPTNAASASEFDRLRSSPKCRKVGRADLLIASIALANHAVLVTRNLRDFRKVPGLVVTNWVD